MSSRTASAAAPPLPSSRPQRIVLVVGSPYGIDDWLGGPAGRYDFEFVNNEGAGAEVYLEDPETERIYVEVEHFGRGVSRAVTASVPPGTYRWVCITDYTIKYSRPVVVTGDPLPHDVHGIIPVTGLDLRIPINGYVEWITGQLPALTHQVEQLRDALRTGDAAAARRDWLTAHLTYETLGGAYRAYDETGDDINADPPRGLTADRLADADFAGFRKIEAMLWQDRPMATIVPHADALLEAIGQLTEELALPNAITPIDMGRRAHEILEDTLQWDLNGIGDAGSQTELATVDANLTGVWQALDPLRPLLRKLDPYLDETDQQLRLTRQLVRSHHHADGWVGLAALSVRQRAAVNAAVQHSVELLSHAAVVVDPRNATRDRGPITHD
ncbi:EfeM/EfeO family lipoprotein [Amycolatopsis rhabdoformis]|uniref:EfeM/EfeO family lipoprotein n=1 Tax=Amycolatopsis rhabdoformis TaxID=1448059 RepID=A0ABZ1IF42_9PSEU|nr:EfeM/EfeO family lipoprotein [Amycolatopsis rhabdoformis]WSE32366.1 EfeM/EfeO family lipoprotein [Amycolatopsis rhabdoformis]